MIYVNRNSSAIQLESAALQLLLASAERHMLQTEIKQLCEQAPCCFISVRNAWLNCYENLDCKKARKPI